MQSLILSLIEHFSVTVALVFGYCPRQVILQFQKLTNLN